MPPSNRIHLNLDDVRDIFDALTEITRIYTRNPEPTYQDALVFMIGFIGCAMDDPPPLSPSIVH